MPHSSSPFRRTPSHEPLRTNAFPKFLTTPSRFVVGWLVCSLIAQPAAAATFTWNGTTTGNWNSGANWTGGAPTGGDPTDILVFGGTGTANYQATNNIAGGGVNGEFLLNQLNFTNTPTTVVGTLLGNALEFQGSGASINAANLGAFTNLNKLKFNTNLAIAGAGTGALTFGRVGMADALGGSGNLTIGGSTRTVTIYGSNSNFTGNIALNQGTLAVGGRNALGSGTLTLAASTTLKAAAGPSGKVLNAVTLAGNVTLGGVTNPPNSLELGGTFNLGGATRTLTAATSTETLLSGVVSNGGLTKAGAGTIILGGPNTYVGGTTVGAGTLRVTAGGRLGDNVAGNNVAVSAGGILRLLAPGAIGDLQTLTFTSSAAAYPVLGVGYNALPSEIGALNGLTMAAATTAGVFALDGVNYAKTFDFGNFGNGLWLLGATPYNGRYNGGVINAGDGNMYRLGGGGGTLRFESSYALTGSAALQIGVIQSSGAAVTNNGGTVVLAAPQDYGGGTYLQSGTLVALTNAALGTGNLVLVSGGTLDLRTTNTFRSVDRQYKDRIVEFTASGGLTYGVYNGGLAPTIEIGELYIDTAGSTLTVALPYSVNLANPLLRVNGATTLPATGLATINVGTSAGLELAGTVTGEQLTKSGAGRLILSADNGISAATTVNAGVLSLHHAGALSNKLVMNTGTTLEFRADGTSDGSTIDFEVGSTGGVEFNGAVAVNVDGLTGATQGNTVRLMAGTSFAAASTISLYGGGSTAAGGVPTIQGDKLWGSTAGAGYRLQLSGPISFTGAASGLITLNPIGAELELAGDITEVGGAKVLTKGGRNNLILSGASVLSGAVTVDRGALFVKNSNALTGVSGVTLGSVAGSTLTISWNSDLLLGPGVTFDKPITVNTITGANITAGGSSTLGLLEAGTATYGGGVAINRDFVQLNALLAASEAEFKGVFSGTGNGVAKLGLGTVIFNPTAGTGNTFTGGLTINAGTLVGVAQASGSPFGANNTIRINAGTLALRGLVGATTTSGHALTLAGGGRLLIDTTAGGATTLGLGGLTRVAGTTGTLTIVPTTNSTITAAGLTTTNGIVAPWIARQTSTTDSTATFVGLSGSTLVGATYSATTDLNSATNATVFRATGLTTNALTADRTAYALTSDGQAITGAFTLTVGTGGGTAGLILNNGASIDTTALAFGGAEGVIFVGGTTAGSAAATISAAITSTATSALTKFGPGTLTLASANSYTGATNVNEGTLRLGANGALPGGLLRSVFYGTGVTIASGATLDVNGTVQAIGGLAGDGTLQLGAGSVSVGYGNATSVFNGRFVGDGSSKLIKVGTGTLSLLNNRTDLANSLGELVVQQGTVLLRTYGEAWAGPLKLGAPLPASTLITLRGGTLSLFYGDEVGNSHQDYDFRNNVVVAANSTISHNRLEQDGTGSKAIVMGDLTIGSQTLTTSGGSLHSMVFDETTLAGNAVFSTAIGLGLRGAIHGDWTINKIGSTMPMYVNADNAATFSGGIVVNQGGLYFGDRVGSLPVPNAAANAGSGHVLLNPFSNSSVRLASAANIQNRLFVISNPSQISRVELLADMNLAALGLNALGSGELGLGSSHWTTPIDLAMLGDGTWYLGAFGTNGEGSGSTMAVNYTTMYTADTLGAGKNNTYRFGGGNFGTYATGGYGVLAIQKANVLTGTSTVIVGAPATVPSTTGTPTLPTSTTGTLQLYADQNYTGATTIFRGSTGATPGTATLDFRGTLATPRIEVLGTLTASGGGRFTNDGLTNLNEVILRPGSALVLDFWTPGATGFANLDNTTGQSSNGFTNKWGDDVLLHLNGATLELGGMNGLQSNEYIGALRLSTGADLRVRGLGTGGAMTLYLGSALQRDTFATLTISAGTVITALGATTGVPGKVIFSNAADAPQRGAVGSTTVNMTAPWLIAGAANAFLDYDPVNGFTAAAFTQTNNSTTFSAGANNGTAIVDSTLSTTTPLTQTNTGTSSVYALRFGNTSATAAAVTLSGGTINLYGGGLLTQTGITAAQTITIAANLYFGDGANPIDANIYTASHTTMTEAPTTNTTVLSGNVTAANLIKAGPGILSLTGTNSIAGKIQVNNGTLRVTAQAAAGGANEFLLGGANATYGGTTTAGNTPFVTLDLRSNTSTSFGTISLLEGVPQATISIGNAGSGTSQTLSFAALFLNTGNVAGGQLLNFNATSSYVYAIDGPTNIYGGGSAVFNVAGTLNLNGSLSSDAKLVKMGAGTLDLALNSFLPSLDILAGAVTARNANSLGQGTVTLAGGTLSLVNAASTNFLANNNLLVNGTATLSYSRVAGTATVSAPFNHFIGSVGNKLTLSDAVLTLSAAQAYTQLVVSSPTIVERPSVLSPSGGTTYIRFDEAISGAGLTLTKNGNGRVFINAENTFSGTLRVTDGLLVAQSAAARFTGAGGRIEVLPGGGVSFAGAGNAENSGGIALFASNSNAMSAIALRYLLGAGDLTTILPSGADVSLGNRGGILLLDMTYSQPIDLGAVYNGNWWLGMSIANATMGGVITAGNGNTYRLGGGGGNLSISANGVLNGPTNKVLWGKPNTYNGTIAPVINGNQTYGGGTVMSRGSVIYVRSGNTNAPFGTGAVEVHGTVEFDLANGSAVAGLDGVTGGNRNAYVFHPGAIVRFDNLQGGYFATSAATGGRWADTAPIALNGSNVTMLGDDIADGAETVGAISYDRGSSIIITRGASTFNVTLTAASLTRLTGGTGTATVGYTAGALGGTAAGYERLMLAAAPTITNGMLDPSLVGSTDHQYLTYDATVGVKLVDTAAATYQSIAAATTTGVSGGNKILNVGAALTLNGALDVYALRTGFSLTNGTASQVTIRSGGYLATTTATIAPNVFFGDGATTTDAFVYAAGTSTFTGQIRASSVIKFGSGALAVGADQTQFAGPWVLNTGTLTTNTLGGFGTSANTIALNGGSSPPLLNFAFDGGSIDPVAFSHGKITAWNNNNIQFNPGAVDRYAVVGDIDLKSTVAVPGGETTGNRIGFLLPTARVYLTTGMVTLFDDYLLNVEASASTLLMGGSSGVTFGGLNNAGSPGYRASIVKNGDGVLTLPDISSTFDDASIYVAQGTLRVTSNGSLGGSGVTTQVEYGGALDVAVADFQPLGSLFFQYGSTERWSLDTARNPATTYTIGNGVTLQLNTNLTSARTIQLAGGTVTGFLRADDDATAVFRTTGPNVTFQLMADSFVGIMNPLTTTGGGPIGDPGKFTAPGTPFGAPYSGAILEIKGSIIESGTSSLTKIGSDTVILSGFNTYTGGTFVREGVLVVGSSGSLPAAGPLGTTAGGTLDLNGYNAVVQQLRGAGGVITNAGTSLKTLTLAAPTGDAYGGQLAGRISLVKNGSGEQILSGANIHQGTTTVNAGRLTLSGSITASPVVVQGSGTFALTSTGVVGSGANGAVTVNSGGTLSGTGTVAGGSTIAAGGSLTNGENVGTLTFTGSVTHTWYGGANIYFDFNNAAGFNPGTDWDFYNFTDGVLHLEATASNPIYFHVDSRTLDNLAHGDNTFDPNGTYSWLFAQSTAVATTGGDSLSSRFAIVDSTAGVGVFGTDNPYTPLPGASFYVSAVGNALYLNYEYSAVPEPSSLLLLLFAAGAGLWYQRRRRPPDALAKLYAAVVNKEPRALLRIFR